MAATVSFLGIPPMTLDYGGSHAYPGVMLKRSNLELREKRLDPLFSAPRD